MSPESLELSLVVILTGLVVVFAALIGLTALIRRKKVFIDWGLLTITRLVGL